MLQVQVLRNNPEAVKAKLAVKHFKQPELVDEIVMLDDDRKRLQTEYDTIQSKVNAASKEIGKLMGQGKKEEAEGMKADVASYKSQVTNLNEMMIAAEKALFDKLVLLPNLPADIVPIGKTPEENLNVKQGGTIPALHAGAVPHWD